MVQQYLVLTKTTTKVSKHLEENWYKLETRKLKSRKGLGEEWGLTGVQVQRKVSIFKIHFPICQYPIFKNLPNTDPKRRDQS